MNYLSAGPTLCLFGWAKTVQDELIRLTLRYCMHQGIDQPSVKCVLTFELAATARDIDVLVLSGTRRQLATCHSGTVLRFWPKCISLLSAFAVKDMSKLEHSIASELSLSLSLKQIDLFEQV
jgi:hypothetical protein